MLIAEKYNVPDSCPKDCPHYGFPFSQDSLCSRCPVLNCRDFGNGFTPILSPKDYRKDWAEEWEKWFKEGMKGLPHLKF